MAIEITEFSNVTIDVAPQAVAGGNFGILGFLTYETGTNAISSAERNRGYTSLESVGKDWAATSEVYKTATSFYAASPTPTDFVVLMQYKTAQAAKIMGGIHLSKDDLVAIPAEDFTLDVDGTPVTVTNLNFSGETSLGDIVTKLNLEFSGSANFIYDTAYKRFLVKSGSSVVGTSRIEFPTGTFAEALGLTQDVATKAEAIDVESAVDALVANKNSGVDFAGLVTHKDYRDNLVTTEGNKTTDIALWCEGSNKIFCNTSNSLGVLDSAVTNDIISELQDSGYKNTISTFSRYTSLYPSAAVFGRAASVNFAATASTITLNLKQMPGIIAEDLTPNQLATLKGKNGNAVIRIGKTVKAYTESRMANGGFFDSVHGLMWLKNRIEVDMFNLLYQSTTKIPYTQTGINIVKATLERSLQAAVRNGLSGSGYLTDGTYLPDGFVVIAEPLANVPSSDKSNRIFKSISFKMVGAGALHEVSINGSFSE
jgi:hypothetical protein